MGRIGCLLAMPLTTTAPYPTRAGRRGPMESVVKTYPIPQVALMRQDSRHHVSAADPAQKRRQDARLLEHRGESASRRWPSGAAPGFVFGRDQFVASRGLAQGNRGVR